MGVFTFVPGTAGVLGFRLLAVVWRPRQGAFFLESPQGASVSQTSPQPKYGWRATRQNPRAQCSTQVLPPHGSRGRIAPRTKVCDARSSPECPVPSRPSPVPHVGVEIITVAAHPSGSPSTGGAPPESKPAIQVKVRPSSCIPVPHHGRTWPVPQWRATLRDGIS